MYRWAIIVAGTKTHRGKAKRVDYLLRYTRDVALAVVEAKADYQTPGAGLQQAKNYAESLGVSFAYSTNGTHIIEFDYLAGVERQLDAFPSPAELWTRVQARSGFSEPVTKQLLTPGFHRPGQGLRYYQDIAVNRTIEAILSGKRRMLLTMATGTGKTRVAFQICWRLWNARWNRTGEHRKPRILYLTDRNILVDDPKDKEFAPYRVMRVVTSVDATGYRPAAGEVDLDGKEIPDRLYGTPEFERARRRTQRLSPRPSNSALSSSPLAT